MLGTILPPVILLILRIIFKTGFVDLISRFDMSGIIGILLGQIIGIPVTRKGKFTDISILVGIALTHILNALFDPFCGGVGIMGRHSVCGPVKYGVTYGSKPGKIIHIVLLQKRKSI